nr:hypothetical protein [Nocardioides daphniae]
MHRVLLGGAAASLRTSSAERAPGSIRLTVGRPWVNVPVLSNATDRTPANVSRAPPSLMITLSFAAELMPPMKATGAAISNGHGVATTSTSAKRTGSPLSHHAMPAIRSETAVKGTAYRSARRTIGARDETAASTSCTIVAYCDSPAVLVARIVKVAVPFIVPDSSAAPASYVTGTGSPVTDDSSMTARSESSTPSTGRISEERTSSASPTSTSPRPGSARPRRCPA